MLPGCPESDDPIVAEPPREKAPRVLVVSVNPFSETSNNGKTFASFFMGYPKDSLAQLFFHREAPTSSVCERYYRIGDEEYVRYQVGWTRVLGAPTRLQEPSPHPFPETATSTLKQSPLIRFLRLAAWSRLRLHAGGVKDWIDDFDPELIFFCGGDANYLYRPVIDLAQRHGIPLILYVTDDYVLPPSGGSVIERLKRCWTRRLFLATTQRAARVLTIGDAMTEVYRDRYGITSIPIMNLVDLPTTIPNRGVRPPDAPLDIVYAGGLHLGRWRTLLAVADSLGRLANRGGPGARLQVYSTSIPPEARAIHNHPLIDCRGALQQDEVAEVLSRAHVLVHVESFEPEARQATLLSISTKIPEYMASGNCILAVGPPEVASIRYLSTHAAAFVATSDAPLDIDPRVAQAMTSSSERVDYIDNATRLVRQNHDGPAIRARFQSDLVRLVMAP